jgi:hypothetical protein
VVGIRRCDHRVAGVEVRRGDGRTEVVACDWLISSMPLTELVLGMDPPAAVAESAQLGYRDF